MEFFACEELNSLTRRLKYAMERKNELIVANLFGRWMMAAEADLTRTNELLMSHHATCSVCNAQWRQVNETDSEPMPIETEFIEEQYPPEDPEFPFRAPPRRIYRMNSTETESVLLHFPSTNRLQ
jgi:hypothetical protein